VGWSSQGVSKDICLAALGELRQNWRTGAGPQTLKELRESGLVQAAAAAAAERESRQAPLTLGHFWVATVRPQISLTYTKNEISSSSAKIKKWLGSLLDRPLAAITTADLENMVVKPLLEIGRSPATIEGVLRLFSIIWHRARKLKLVQGDCPVIQAKRPKFDNRRERFLSPAEAQHLLEALQKRSIDAHDLALMALFTGLRAGACQALTWADINLEERIIFVKDTKNKENRHAFITEEVRAMLIRRRAARPEAWRVFYGQRGRLTSYALSIPFRQTVQALGFNEGVTDSRQRVVFHTLRHTFASWLVMKGQPLYTVSKLLGHKDLKMTERYAHLAPDTQRAAVVRLEGSLQINEVKLQTQEGE
jgi:integrase